MKTYLEDNLNVKVLSVDSLEVMQIGAWDNEREMKYRDAITLEGLVTQAGPNLMLNTGALSGYHIELKKEELNRKFPVHISFPCSFDHTITIDIPQGYEAKGVEKLNHSVTNKTGGFVSKATVSGNKLTINTSKYYTDYVVATADWPLMVDFMEAAYDFSQQKVLLQKSKLSSK
ncbi:MAG: hypothetical protein EOP51_24710 [Sphingobacteriales bacterium]|nr:MAG: hypothetical protein EOP51_24710 [Sphingobacteriales bacterium]